MVLDTFTNDMVDLSSMIHPFVMAHEEAATVSTTSSSSSSSSSSSGGFIEGLESLFCNNETFAAYCTITRNADGTESKTITTENWLELGGIAIAV